MTNNYNEASYIKNKCINRRRKHLIKKKAKLNSKLKYILNTDYEPVESPNRILSENVSFSYDLMNAKLPNSNTMIVGGSGSKKTTTFLYSNIMQLYGSYVICDPKGEITQRLVPLAKKAKYDVKILDLIDPYASTKFNPFEYIERPEDIPSMISFIFRGFDTSKTGTTQDPFWDNANMLELCAICYLLWYDARKEDCTLATVMDIVDLGSVEVERACHDENGATILENNKPKKVKKSGLQWLFHDFARKHGQDNLVMDYYRKFNTAKDKTFSNIQITLVSKMQMLTQPSIKYMMQYDEMKLKDIGRKKTMLFLKCPPSDDRFYFLISVLYMFLYRSLDYVADVEENGNGCRVPVTIMEDEFTSFPQPDNFLSILQTCRSRNYSICHIFQDIARLKQMKGIGDSWGALFGNCASILYYGSDDNETNEYFSKLMGKETIDVKTKGQKGSNYSKIGRELFTADELKEVNRDYTILLLAGHKPIMDKKYPFLNHANVKLTAIYRDGSGQPIFNNSIQSDKINITVDN